MAIPVDLGLLSSWGSQQSGHQSTFSSIWKDLASVPKVDLEVLLFSTVLSHRLSAQVKGRPRQSSRRNSCYAAHACHFLGASPPLSLHSMWLQFSPRPWPVVWEVGRPSIGRARHLLESRPEGAKMQHGSHLHVHSCEGTVGESLVMPQH